MTADPRYRGLLIGNATFPRDPHTLLDLRGPLVDIEELAQALTDDRVGLFSSDNVQRLPDKKVQELREHLNKFFTAAVREDVLLLYYSGHGRLDERNRLYLCASDTTVDLPYATALSAAEINNMIDGSAAATVIIVLDCCHSGAWKSDADLATAVKGKGRYVLASNRSTQLARAADVEGQPSPFTGMLVRGLRHAETTGYLTVSELYRHVHRWMTKDTRRTPQLKMVGEGDVVIARREKNRPRPHAQQLRRRELPAQDPAARPTAPRPAKKKVKKGKPTTQKAPVAAKSFEESWTGDEAPQGFSKQADATPYLIAAVSLMFFLATHFGKSQGANQVAGYVTACLALLAAFLVEMWAGRKLRANMRARTLRIGGDGVTAIDPSGTQLIPWTAIRQVGVHHSATAVHGHKLLAVHVRLHMPNPEGSPSALYRPAGWPIRAELPDVCRGHRTPTQYDWIPVCVLGPLPGPRRVDLKNVVAAHTEHPLETEGDW
ncbi:caspase family protein [Streptomyces sp. 8N616]|uniref:caspase family protein n=1 Tax=Streptomyces sp. 8N616 TaxID=3457414 RepID=UPI003FD3D17F